MASGRFSKQAAPFLQAKYLNSVNDSVPGGTITAAPSGLTIGQFQQNIPGDRIILSPMDALAYSNNSVGNLYTGTYRYVVTNNNSTASPAIGRSACWDPTGGGAFSGNNIGTAKADATYAVTADGNSANYTNTLFAGVYINNMNKGYAGWIQESGKCTVRYRAVLTNNANTPAIGMGVYLINPAPANNNVDNGAFDSVSGANIGAGPITSANMYATIDNLLINWIGVAETAPSSNNTGIVDIPFSVGGTSFRW
jgi:hypothetical protein